MCGIFLYFGTDKQINVYDEFMKTSHRGPDNSHIIVQDNMFIGFHRLSINDVSLNGSQPFTTDNCIAMCNGEIYNFRHLISTFNLHCRSNSDCEVIIHLYNKLKNEYDINTALRLLCKSLDGEFAFIIYDKQLHKIIVCRDRYGVRPLFIGYNNTEFKNIGFCSELKSLNSLFDNVEQFIPSTYGVYDLKDDNVVNKSIHYYNSISETYDINNNNMNILLPEIKKIF